VLLNGSATLFDYLNDNRKEILVLEHFNYYEKGVDRGILVRQKLSWLNRVLDSKEEFQLEKNKSHQVLNNLTPFDVSGLSRKVSTSPNNEPEDNMTSPGTKQKKARAMLKINVKDVDLKKEEMNEGLIDKDEYEANVHFNSVPINKSDLGFFKDLMPVSPGKVSHADARSIIVLT
jgi:hypothetical protein